ncbi:MAG: penicillin-binding protein 2 [Clostridia bacterium]|nr:penicillin-binding protein 2 [Clostridia bacterium]
MQKRALVCFLICVILLFISVMRVATIATTDFSKVSNINNGIRLKISNSRGTIYDRNRVRLTNSQEKIIACVSPTPRAITAISKVLKGDDLQEVLDGLKSNKPVICEVPRKIDCDGIVCTTIYTDTDTPSRHIIGYTNSDNHGVSGIENAYDSLLFSENDISIFYNTDAKGRILEGLEPELTNDNRVATHGVVTTLDINIQSIAEECAENLEKGAIVVADLKGKIRASVSRPSFERNNVSIYLNSESSPLLNRAISAYNVGSVFKPCVAVAGLESDKGDFEYTCTGSCEIIDRFFKCHNLDGHGLLGLRGGLAHSCNTYFYNFAFNVGYDKIFKTAKAFNFDQSIKLCERMSTAKGSLPQKASLENIAHLANFSIGQGELLLSPISMLTLYCAIASNGEYYIPSLVEGVIENGKYSEYNIGLPTKVFNGNTAKILREYLVSVLEEGTGEAAKPKTVTAAGKTATAQTGKFENGREICEGWFCGFFPAENPEYVAIIFSEDDRKQTLSCGQIFSILADRITPLKF